MAGLLKKQDRLSKRIFPFLAWRRDLSAAAVGRDVLAGLTVAVVLIPQSMAYAMLAGLPPVCGLYAAAITPVVASLWGSLRQLATGPIAITSLLVLTTLSPLAEPGSPHFVTLAMLLSLIVAALYLAMGFFRLGFVMAFISHSAVRGFTSAAALIITATQLPALMGIATLRHEYLVSMLIEMARSPGAIHPPTFGLGLASVAIIYGLKRWRPRFPAGLTGLAIATGAVILFDLDRLGVAVLGEIAAGLPPLRLPVLDLDVIENLVGPGVVIALVGFAETYAVGREISSQTHQRLDVDQELIGQGLANLTGAFFQCGPVSGSFSRSAIAFSAGARTGLAGVVSGLTVVPALLWLTPLVTRIPKAALAALVISAVMTLFHPGQMFRLWRMNRHDGIVAVTVFVFCLLTQPDYALLLGVLMSLIFFLWKTMHPRMVVLTRDPDAGQFVDAEDTGLPGCPQILHLRSENALYFGNAEYTEAGILAALDQRSDPIRFLLLDCSAIGFVDITGIDALRSLDGRLGARGVALVLVDVHRPVMAVLESSGLAAELGEQRVISHKWEAIHRVFQGLDHTFCRDTCPYRLFAECQHVKAGPP